MTTHSTLRLGSLTAEPGQKAQGFEHASAGIVDVRLPLVLINGARPGPRLAITAGLHGGEFVGIEALREVLRATGPVTLAGQVVACPLACPPIFYADRSATSPLDGVNPNRVCPGSPTGLPTERVVAWLFENVVRGSDVFIDLHSGGVAQDLASFVSFRSSGREEQDLRAVELAELFGISVFCGGPPTGGNSHAAGARAGAVSLLVEVGGRGIRSGAEVDLVRDGLLRVMKRLAMIDDAPAGPAAPVERWRWAHELEAPVEGLWYPEFEVGEEVEAGRVLGRILDPLDSVLAVVTAPYAGKIFYGERGLSIASGDVLAAIATRHV